MRSGQMVSADSKDEACAQQRAIVNLFTCIENKFSD